MAVITNRRQFVLGWIGQNLIVQNRSAQVEVEVIEVFSASEGPSALLVHHATEAGRNRFSEWLRTNDGLRIMCRLRNRTVFDGRIFRVKMCFGRGLILAPARISVRAKDILNID